MTDPGKLVLVEWVDSFGCSPSWSTFEDIDPKPLVCRSVGWIRHENALCVVVVPHIATVPDQPDQGCGDMTIPICAITRRVELEPKVTP